jgi:L-ascorbate metabolism protein UlaG (beta-lactamase superfamily)
MKLIAELYAPTVGLIGLGGLAHLPHEMNAREAALAAEWLGVRRAVPMHLIPRSGDGEAFASEITARGLDVAVDVLVPGDVLELSAAVAP